MGSKKEGNMNPTMKGGMRRFIFSFKAYGHENIRATHRTTLEITKDESLTERGDCIIAVNSTIGLSELPEEMKDAMRKEGSKIVMVMECEGLRDEVVGEGNPRLKLSHDRDMVCRKSNYVCPRTLMVNANKSAIDIDRRIVEAMRKRGREMKITLIVVY